MGAEVGRRQDGFDLDHFAPPTLFSSCNKPSGKHIRLKPDLRSKHVRLKPDVRSSLFAHQGLKPLA